MTTCFAAFSSRGEALARRLAGHLGGTVTRLGGEQRLNDWTARAFAEADRIIFVGAVGIAVRAIAPYIVHKTTDPAVVAVDECGHFAVPVLSGHLGGANDLAREIAALVGAVPVLTTATDANGIFSPDSWARCQGCAVADPKGIRTVSARLLAGERLGFYSDQEPQGQMPACLCPAGKESADIVVSVFRSPAPLHLVPQVAVLGVGCKKGTPESAIEAAFAALLEKENLSEKAFCRVASIDLKKEEPGLLAFCRARGLPFTTHSAQALAALPGRFTPSAFVAGVTGVDNVCERSAVACGGVLAVPKTAAGGVTLAVALLPFTPDWRWHYGG